MTHTTSTAPHCHTQVQVELKKGETIMTDASLHLPAAFLHEAFSNRSGVPPDHFELYYRGKRLEGEAALASYGIGKDATIEVKMRGRGGTNNQKSKRPQDSEGKQTSTSAVHVEKKGLLNAAKAVEEDRAAEATKDRALQDENAKLRAKLISLQAQTQATAGSANERSPAAGAGAAEVERQAVKDEARREAEKEAAVVKAQEEAKAVVVVEAVTVEAAEAARLRAEKTKAEARAVAKVQAGGTGVSVFAPELNLILKPEYDQKPNPNPNPQTPTATPTPNPTH